MRQILSAYETQRKSVSISTSQEIMLKLYKIVHQLQVTYTHADGSEETVSIIKEHSDAEYTKYNRTISLKEQVTFLFLRGGGITVFIPSLQRERMTVENRLKRVNVTPSNPNSLSK